MPSRPSSRPFRGSRAIAAGLLTRAQLRGPRFRRLLYDVYIDADAEVDLTVWSVAAWISADGRGVLGGWSAAELLGASCGPQDAPAELIVPTRRRAQPGLSVRRARLRPEEIVERDGVLVTDHRSTAFDLGRRPPLVEAVVAIDALARVGEFEPAELVAYSYDRFGMRGSRLLLEAIPLADRLSGSPMETRIRLALHHAGLPRPVLQHVVGPYALDLSYPGVLLAIEYDGREHLTPERARRDLARQAHLTRAGWDVLRFAASDVLNRPWWVAAQVRRELERRGVLAT